MELNAEALREVVLTELIPADSRLMAAMGEAAQALLYAEEVRNDIRKRFPRKTLNGIPQSDGIFPATQGIHTEISRRLTPQIGTGTYGGVQLIHVTTGRDLVAAARSEFDLEEDA